MLQFGSLIIDNRKKTTIVYVVSPKSSSSRRCELAKLPTVTVEEINAIIKSTKLLHGCADLANLAVCWWQNKAFLEVLEGNTDFLEGNATVEVSLSTMLM